MTEERRTPVVVVAGWNGATASAAESLLDDGTVIVEHDLRAIHQGVVRRTLRSRVDARTTVLELAHGCVSCTLREDLLPLLRKLSARSNVRRIVLALDRILEPEAVCWAIRHVVVEGVVGQLDGPAGRDVRIDAVLTCIDATTWLDDATGDDALVDRGIVASPDDERTVAQLVVGQVEYADAVLIDGEPENPWHGGKLEAVLTRLAPHARLVWAPAIIAASVVETMPAHARRGALTEPHSSLLRGQPPLNSEFGVTIVEFNADRPFHPERLHEALDVLLDGVVATRGRAWVATQPDVALWVESAGGGLRVAHSGKWLAAMTPDEQAAVDPERTAMAAARWNDRYGDRATSLVILAHDADPTTIDRALQWALVSDTELADETAWSRWLDPFGEWHADPCELFETDSVEAEFSRKDAP